MNTKNMNKTSNKFKSKRFGSIMVGILMSTTTFAQGGSGHIGGGGDIEAADFVKYYRYSLEAIQNDLSTVKPVFTREELIKLINSLQTVQVFSVHSSELCNGSTCEDAHYDPIAGNIKVSKESWKKFDCMKKMNLVLHEFGRAAGLEDANYVFSSKIYLSKAFASECSMISSNNQPMPPVSMTALQMRDRFAKATTPSIDYMTTHTFQCSSYNAGLNPDSILPQPFRIAIGFSKKDNDSITIQADGMRIDQMTLTKFFYGYDMGAMAGKKDRTDMPGMIIYQSYRVEANGTLIGEYSVVHPELQYGIPYLDPITNYRDGLQEKVWSYAECKPLY